MVSIECTVGIREEELATILKWYSLLFKTIHPSKPDEDCYNLIRVIYTDLKKCNKEESEGMGDE